MPSNPLDYLRSRRSCLERHMLGTSGGSSTPLPLPLFLTSYFSSLTHPPHPGPPPSSHPVLNSPWRSVALIRSLGSVLFCILFRRSLRNNLGAKTSDLRWRTVFYCASKYPAPLPSLSVSLHLSLCPSSISLSVCLTSLSISPSLHQSIPPSIKRYPPSLHSLYLPVFPSLLVSLSHSLALCSPAGLQVLCYSKLPKSTPGVGSLCVHVCVGFFVGFFG